MLDIFPEFVMCRSLGWLCGYM